jgi:hypothetical protein
VDAIVEKALAKWPNVPHCYGWLALDARGNWRMRDEHAQQNNLPGEKITQPTLLGFIRRNYTHDENGRWYFQNGPQRVYVDLEVTPYIAHTDSAAGFVLHTGEPLPEPDFLWMTENGKLLLQKEKLIALLDDRDLSECLSLLCLQERPVNDDQLMAWLDAASSQRRTVEELTLNWCGKYISVGFVKENSLAERFDFVRTPRAES